jgi:hypothetical protein
MIGVSHGKGDFYRGNREPYAGPERPFTSVGGVALRCQCRPTPGSQYEGL